MPILTLFLRLEALLPKCGKGRDAPIPTRVYLSVGFGYGRYIVMGPRDVFPEESARMSLIW
jgi:hypothetical protein